jgi:multidrug transporter EmrE-like cation transporter
MSSPSPSVLPNGSAALPCLLWATIGAVTAVISSTSVAYPNFLEQKHKELKYSKSRKTLHAVLNVVFSLISVGCFIKATGYGPVALAMPLQTGMSLLLNMVVQTALRMKRYTKEMTAGTLVLVCAVIILVDVGPSEQHVDPIPLLKTAPAVIWNSVCVAICIFGAVGIRKSGEGTNFQLMSYSVAISATTVLGASIGKLMQEASGFAVIIFIALYIIIGVLNLYWSAQAAGSTDLSLLMPVKSSVSLALNCITGLLVWQDWRVIEAWTSYVMVYFLILLGVYTCAAGVDFVASWSLQRHLKGAMLSEGIASSSFGRAVQQLIIAWQNDPNNNDATIPAMRAVLKKGLRSGAIKTETLLELTMQLFNGYGCHPSKYLINWMNNDWDYFQMYLKHDPKFHDVLYSLAVDDDIGEKLFDDQVKGNGSLNDSSTTPLI